MTITSCDFSPSSTIHDYAICGVVLTIDGCIKLYDIEIFEEVNPETLRLEKVVMFPSYISIPDHYTRLWINGEILERYRLWLEIR